MYPATLRDSLCGIQEQTLGNTGNRVQTLLCVREQLHTGVLAVADRVSACEDAFKVGSVVLRLLGIGQENGEASFDSV
jgi:hypothetical protein